jgi:hypothetical protein
VCSDLGTSVGGTGGAEQTTGNIKKTKKVTLTLQAKEKSGIEGGKPSLKGFRPHFFLFVLFFFFFAKDRGGMKLLFVLRNKF